MDYLVLEVFKFMLASYNRELVKCISNKNSGLEGLWQCCAGKPVNSLLFLLPDKSQTNKT